jgi:hypothetical protein
VDIARLPELLGRQIAIKLVPPEAADFEWERSTGYHGSGAYRRKAIFS